MSSTGISIVDSISKFGLNVCLECEYRFTGCRVKILHGRATAMIGGIPSPYRNKSKCIINNTTEFKEFREIEFCKEVIDFCKKT
jgi:hypothetical protein